MQIRFNVFYQIKYNFEFLYYLYLIQNRMSYTFLFKYIIIGDSGVGKSCLLLQYTDKKYREKHQVTIGVEFGAKMINIHGNNIKLQIWDTAGQQSFQAITRGYYRNAIGAIICYDISSRQSFNSITKWLEQAQSNNSSCLNFVLVGNKSDKQHECKVSFQQGLRYAKEKNIPLLQSSAKQGSNIEQIFNVLTESILNRIESNILQIKNHPGVKIGSQKYKPIKGQFAETVKNQDQRINIGKVGKKQSACCK